MEKEKEFRNKITELEANYKENLEAMRLEMEKKSKEYERRIRHLEETHALDIQDLKQDHSNKIQVKFSSLEVCNIYRKFKMNSKEKRKDGKKNSKK